MEIEIGVARGGRGRLINTGGVSWDIIRVNHRPTNQNSFMVFFLRTLIMLQTGPIIPVIRYFQHSLNYSVCGVKFRRHELIFVGSAHL